MNGGNDVKAITLTTQRQRKARNEVKLALWSVALQIVFWMPFNVVSILSNLRSELPYLLDISAFFIMVCGDAVAGRFADYFDLFRSAAQGDPPALGWVVL